MIAWIVANWDSIAVVGGLVAAFLFRDRVPGLKPKDNRTLLEKIRDVLDELKKLDTHKDAVNELKDRIQSL